MSFSPYFPLKNTLLFLWFVVWTVRATSTLPSGPKVKQYSDTQSFEKYGCPYINEFYDILPTKNQNPAWGNQVFPLELRNGEEFEVLMEKLRLLLGNFLNSILFNNIDDFVVFQQEYLKSNSSKEQFYAQYKPNYIIPETLAFQGIGFMEYIVAHTKSDYPTIFQHLYSVSVDAYPPQSLVHSINSETGLPRKKDMYPVMACLKFLIKSDDIAGHILFDPAFDMPHPVVVTQDGFSPNTGEMRYGNKIVKCDFLNKNENYILCHRNTITSNGQQNKSSMLIYVGRPYCSVLNFSHKPSLTGALRSISKRDRVGVTQVAIHFNAEIQKKENRKGEYTNMAPIEIFVLNPNMWKSLHFGNLEILTKEEMETINIANDKLSLKPGKLFAKLQAVRKIMEESKVEDFTNYIRVNEREVIKRVT